MVGHSLYYYRDGMILCVIITGYLLCHPGVYHKVFFSQDDSTSLIKYLVRCYVKLYVTSETGTESDRFPLPEPSDLIQASHVDFHDIAEELDRIRMDFGCESHGQFCGRHAVPYPVL